MPSILNVKPEDLDSKDKRSKILASVVGCGQKGVFFAVTLANAGYRVVCCDADASVVKKLAKGKAPSAQPVEGALKALISQGQLSVSSEIKQAVAKSDLIIITVPAKVDDNKKIDNSEAINACKQVGSALHAGALVVYGDIVGLGFTEGTAKETLENTSGLKADADFGLAYMPLNPACNTLNVAGVGKVSLEAAANIAQTLAANVVQVKDAKTAEFATLFYVAKQDASKALANELAVFCENANIDYFEALRLLGLGDKSFWPSAVEHQGRDGAYLLLESADNINVKLRLPALSRQINEDMSKHAVNLTQDALRSCSKSLRRAKVAVLGTANSTTATAVFVKLLELKGAKVNFYDPASKGEPLGTTSAKNNLNEAVEGADCVVILTGEEQSACLNLKKLRTLTRTPSAIIDLAGTCDPSRVQAEGFIYRGLGRGVDKT